MAAIPAAFKTVLSAIKRAEECEKSPDRNNQVLAYACRLYALNKAMKLSTRSSEESTFLVQQMDLLEAAKKQFNIAEAEAKTAVETQATLLFNKADEIDRAGYADKGTAKLFYAAATYFDVFEHFGDLAVEVLEMRKYCKWKAAEIINACNSGVKPTPGGYGEMSHMNEDVSANSIPDVTSLNNLSLQPPTQAPQAPPSNPSYSQPAHSPPPSYNYPSSPTPSYQQPPPQPQYQQQPPPQYTAAPIQAPSANSVVTNRPPSYPGQSRAPPLSNTDPRVKDAVEICNFAISALKHNEIAVAKDRLQEALRRLG